MDRPPLSGPEPASSGVIAPLDGDSSDRTERSQHSTAFNPQAMARVARCLS